MNKKIVLALATLIVASSAMAEDIVAGVSGGYTSGATQVLSGDPTVTGGLAQLTGGFSASAATFNGPNATVTYADINQSINPSPPSGTVIGSVSDASGVLGSINVGNSQGASATTILTPATGAASGQALTNNSSNVAIQTNGISVNQSGYGYGITQANVSDANSNFGTTLIVNSTATSNVCANPGFVC